jgi:hypothetical protein
MTYIHILCLYIYYTYYIYMYMYGPLLTGGSLPPFCGNITHALPIAPMSMAKLAEDRDRLSQ